MILFINSPGGTTTGGEALFEAIRELAKVKPVVGQMGTVAASAAYIAGHRHRPHRGARQHHHRLGRRDLPVAGGFPADGQARRQDERDQERPAEGQPVAVPAGRRGGQGGSRADGGRIATLVRRPGGEPPRHRHGERCRPRAGPRLSRAARRLPTSSWTRSAARPRRSSTWRRSATSPRACKVVDFKPKSEGGWGLLGLSVAALGRLVGERDGRRHRPAVRQRRRARQIAP